MKPRDWIKSEESMVFSFRKLRVNWELGYPRYLELGLVPDKRPGLRGKSDTVRLSLFW